MTTMKRVFYPLGAAAMLLGAAPALADDAGPAHDCAASCPCARTAKPGPKAGAPAQPAASAGPDDAFLRQVWSAP